MFAEDVAEVGADAAAGASAVSAHGDADGGRAEVREVERGVVAGFLIGGVRRRKSFLRLVEIGGDGRSSSAQRRQLTGARGIGRGGGGHGERGRIRRQLVNVVVVVLEQGEGDLAGTRGDRHGGGQVGDAGDPGLHVSDASDGVFREPVAEDVGDPFRIRQEVEAAAIGGELRIEVFGVVEQRQCADLAGGDIDRRDSQAVETQLIEIGVGAAVRHEGKHAAVGRPCRLQIGVLVAGELPDVVAVQIVEKQVGHPGLLPGESDGVTVR